MVRQTRDQDLLFFMDMVDMGAVNGIEDVPLYVVVPSYIISELRIAFQIGFMIYLPFMVIDLVVTSILLSMGIIFLPPVLVSLPFKILVFVLTDGRSEERRVGKEYKDGWTIYIKKQSK